MEENTNKPSYEQLEKAVIMWKQRCINTESRLAALNMTTIRLDYLFKVLKYEDAFDTEFIQKCVNEIKSLLEIEEEGKTKE